MGLHPSTEFCIFLNFFAFAGGCGYTWAMANQRKAGKKKVGFWVSDSEKAAMMREAKKAGFDNLADWLRSLITKGAGVIIAGLLLFHLVRSPRAWTAAELAGTAKALFGQVAKLAR